VGDLAVGVRERAREGELDVLLDRERAVAEDVDADVCGDEVVRLRGGARRERERSEGRGNECRDEALQREKSTFGGSRSASSSTSKNSRIENPKGPARTTPGKVWTVLLYVRTESL
jgi:hypothetical protein